MIRILHVLCAFICCVIIVLNCFILCVALDYNSVINIFFIYPEIISCLLTQKVFFIFREFSGVICADRGFCQDPYPHEFLIFLTVSYNVVLYLSIEFYFLLFGQIAFCPINHYRHCTKYGLLYCALCFILPFYVCQLRYCLTICRIL